MERKWAETLFRHKQHWALGSQLEALTKEKKEKENVLIDLELMNLKSVFLLSSKKHKRKIVKEKQKKVGPCK